VPASSVKTHCLFEFFTSKNADSRIFKQTMMNGFRGIGWIKDKSNSGKLLSDFLTLSFVYTIDEDVEDFLDKRPNSASF
jgi:hypothetical protein